MGFARDLGVPDDPSLTVDQRIAVVATRHFGVIDTDHLEACGLSGSGIKRRVANGSLRRRYPGVFAVGHDALSEDGELSAALLACGEWTLLDGFASANRWGLGRFPSKPIRVVVDRSRRDNAPLVRGIETRKAWFAPQDIRVRRGLPVMSLARTLLELAKRVEAPELTKAFQRARRKGLTLAQVVDVLTRHHGCPGTPRLRKVLDRVRGQRGVTRGGFEDEVYAWFDDWLPPGFPRPEVNVFTGENGEFESDLYFRGHGLLVEIDFDDHHANDRTQRARDTRRDRRLLIAELRTVRITNESSRTIATRSSATCGGCYASDAASTSGSARRPCWPAPCGRCPPCA
jgi:hypothetical protein